MRVILPEANGGTFCALRSFDAQYLRNPPNKVNIIADIIFED
ncbi:hypothetical protein [Rhizorhabdus histidinilytica]|nr:hypothetical protein [Rhizorhabdus histidinilytica]